MSGAKENEVYVVPSAEGQAGWGVEGVFCRDTIWFDQWRWDLGDARRLFRRAVRNRIDEYHCLTHPDRSQKVGLRRSLLVSDRGFTDSWTAVNSSGEAQTVTLGLSARPRLVDIFASRLDPANEVTIEETVISAQARRLSRIAGDGQEHSVTLRCDRGLGDPAGWSLDLEPGESATLTLEVVIAGEGERAAALPALPSYDAWRASFADLAGAGAAVEQAIEDLRALLLRTEHGPYPAAGLPIFVNFFGRDALIAGMMILDWRPDILRSVLAFLAAHQGGVHDPFREEEPGKILHEIRRGELSRTNRIPFGRYYGSIDSTPLFLMAAGAYAVSTGDHRVAEELGTALEAATDWLAGHLDGPTGLATFKASGSGLTVQSWKDSANSMVDEHGHPAKQPLAVAEVQGYAYAALLAAADLLPERADTLRARAVRLRDAFHRLFWLEDLGTYAMALDGDMQPLRVQSSDPGHLLWTGIVPDAIAPTLVETLMAPALWSGWGLRTLGSAEAAYNPVSYHNGSVWPHDTGIFAMGLARYGFDAELREVAQALLDLATASPGQQMPELISGFDRTAFSEPVPYTHANVPQAWAAATVIRMASYLHGGATPCGVRR